MIEKIDEVFDRKSIFGFGNKGNGFFAKKHFQKGLNQGKIQNAEDTGKNRCQ